MSYLNEHDVLKKVIELVRNRNLTLNLMEDTRGQFIFFESGALLFEFFPDAHRLSVTTRNSRNDIMSISRDSQVKPDDTTSFGSVLNSLLEMLSVDLAGFAELQKRHNRCNIVMEALRASEGRKVS